MTTFKAIVGDQAQTYRFDERDGGPVKLGDGSFAAVFRVSGPGNQLFAAKLFYETQDPSVIQRFRYEMDARERLLSSVEPGDRMALEQQIPALVLPIAKTEEFRESDAFKHYERWFEQTGLSVSDYALVMPLFACTLKELMEHGAPAGRLVGGNVVSLRGSAGYGHLARLPHRDRESLILPIIWQVSNALRALHAGSLHHHDLKPANILLRSAAGRLEAALADFGFLLPNQYAGTSTWRLGEALPLGTRHYRSTEQKDYFDICEVDVVVKESAARPIMLVTQDRKFLDTIIEPGDCAVFFKDPKRSRREIISVEHDRSKGESYVYLKPDKTKTSPDLRTQVIFYKMHTARTDLFGIGALLFDLLTCGHSPERFYDYLRPFDRADEERGDEESGGIAALMTRYKALSTAPSTVPGFSAIFDQLRASDSSYPSAEVVAIMLKCLLSAPSDSYFRSREATGGRECFDRLAADLKRAMDSRGAATYLADDHPLWSDTELPEPKVGESSFAKKLIEIQRLGGEGTFGKRILSAYRMMRKIVTTANGASRDAERQEKGVVFFSSLSPDNLTYAEGSESLSLQRATYADRKQYHRAVLSGDALGIGGTVDRDNYVPPCLRFQTRQVHIESPKEFQHAQTDGTKSLMVSIRYGDSYPFWTGMSVGDFLRMDDSDAGAVLFVVEEVADGGVVIRPAEDNGGAEHPTFRPGRALAMKSLRPLDYYLSMIGMYIHQLFFVDGHRDTGSLPGTVWFVEQARSAGYLGRVLSDDPAAFMEGGQKYAKDEVARVIEVLRPLSRLYLWLVCRDYRTDVAGEDVSELSVTDLFSKVLEAMNNVQRSVALALNIPKETALESMSDEEVSQGNWLTTCSLVALPTLEELLGEIVRPRKKSWFEWK